MLKPPSVPQKQDVQLMENETKTLDNKSEVQRAYKTNGNMTKDEAEKSVGWANNYVVNNYAEGCE